MSTNEHSKGIEELSVEELRLYRFFAGHFDYGYHCMIKGSVLYIGVVRDPMERLISDYYFNFWYGRPDLKALARRCSLEEYAREKIFNPKSKMGRSGQVEHLSGQRDLGKAIEILESDYLIACTNEQLDRCQELLAMVYGRSDLRPIRKNVNSRKGVANLSSSLKKSLQERFCDDYKLVEYIGRRFDEEFSTSLT